MQRAIFYLILIMLGSLNYGYGQNYTDTTQYKKLTKFSLASIDYTIYSQSEYKKDNEVRDIRMEEYKARLQFAIKLKEKKTYLLNKISLSRFDVSSNNSLSKNFSERYFSLSYSLGVIQVLKNRWRLIGVLSPTMASDFNNEMSTNDFMLQFTLMATKRAGVNFEFGIGAAYSTRFGRALVIPLLSYAYIKGNWEHLGVLPAYISSYYCFRNFYSGFKLSTYGNLYNSNNNISSDMELDNLGYSRINLGPDFKLRIYKSLYANINLGITVRNRLLSINHSGELEMELSADNKYFFNFGLQILK